MYNQSSGQAEEGFEVFGYMLIFTTIWYIGSPFAMPKELLPIIINIVGDCVLFSVLLMSILGNMLGI